MSKTRRMLPVDRWPSVAAFFRGYLHQDAGDQHHSVEAAFTSFWDDANADERLAFAKEWRALRSLVEGRAWHREVGADLGDSVALDGAQAADARRARRGATLGDGLVDHPSQARVAAEDL